MLQDVVGSWKQEARHMRWNWMVILAFWAFFSGCASTHQFASRLNHSPVAPGKVLVQIERPFQWYGSGNTIIVVANEQVVGHLGPLGELLWEGDAGELHLQAYPKVLHVRDFEPITMQTKAGNKYIFRAYFPFFYPISNAGLELIRESQN
jgi:hypothetical protein